MQRELAVAAVGAVLLGACPRHTIDTNSTESADTTRRAVTVVRSCPPESVAVRHVRVARGVVYATPGSTALRFDVAWPASGAPAPLVLLLHGGGWSGGSRTSLDDEMLALARRGYAAATVDYRLTEAPRNVFPAAIADVRCALRILRRRASTYNIAPERVAAMGYSAGGHLASLLGTAASVRGLDEDCGITPPSAGSDDANEVRVQAVVSYAGPQDLRVNGPYTAEQAELVTNFLGVFPGDNRAIATLASPIAHVSAGDPPFLLLNGADDDLVPPDHATRMAAALRAVGTPASALGLRRTGHEFVGFVTSRNASVRCTVEAFLARWLRPT